MAKAKQVSIPKFDAEETLILREAMRIDRIRSRGVWIRRAALMWATQRIAEDRGITAQVDAVIEAENKPPLRNAVSLTDRRKSGPKE